MTAADPGDPPATDSGGSDRPGFAAWWVAHRDRVSLLAIGGLALGGIVCMFLTVLVLVLA